MGVTAYGGGSPHSYVWPVCRLISSLCCKNDLPHCVRQSLICACPTLAVGKIFVGALCDVTGGPGAVALSLSMSTVGLYFVSTSGLSLLSIGLPWALTRCGSAAIRPAMYLNLKPWFVGNGLGAALVRCISWQPPASPFVQRS